MELDHVSTSTAMLGGNFVSYWLLAQLAEGPMVKSSGKYGGKGRYAQVRDRKRIQTPQILLLITGSK